MPPVSSALAPGDRRGPSVLEMNTLLFSSCPNAPRGHWNASACYSTQRGILPGTEGAVRQEETESGRLIVPRALGLSS